MSLQAGSRLGVYEDSDSERPASRADGRERESHMGSIVLEMT
jgi:hypothetical protein